MEALTSTLLRRATRLKDEDNRPGSPGTRLCRPVHLSLQPQQIGKPGAYQAQPANVQQFTTSNLRMIFVPASESAHVWAPVTNVNSKDSTARPKVFST